MKILDRKYLIPILAGIVVFLTTASPLKPLRRAQAASDILVDANSGVDAGSCGTQNQPCASIQHALNMADSGQTIRVAAGTYTFKKDKDICGSFINITAVVCVLDKEVTILGGFAAGNWSVSDPETNVTIIDGENSRRGILVQYAGGDPAALEMAGFTVQNGREQGSSNGPDSETFAFGGGLMADRSTIILRDMIFRNNKALGGNTQNAYGGAAAGGGVALLAVRPGTSLNQITFEGNEARGGSGNERGGFGIGGGLYTFESVVTGADITMIGNVSMGGNSNGDGIGPSGENADGQGGGAAFHRNSRVVLHNVTVEGNQTIGGNAPNGQGGGAFGGGIWGEAGSQIEIVGANIRGNRANGGNGRNSSPGGSVASAGGIGIHNCDFVLDQANVIGNRSIGGDGTEISGSGGGGGVSLVRTTGNSTTRITNSTIADNRTDMGTGSVSGGGGGGISMRGADAIIKHSTIARNEIGSSNMQGSAAVLISSGAVATADLAYSIVAQHDSGNAVHAQPGSTVSFQTDLFHGNSSNYGGGGTFNGVGTLRSGAPNFVSPGPPDYNYHIQDISAAKNAASGSNEATDIDGDPRDAQPDLGADEYVTPEITAIYVSPIADDTILVRWEKQGASIVRYELLVRSTSGGGETTIDVGSQQQWEVSGLTEGDTYQIEVRAYDSSDIVVDSSSETFTFTVHLNYLPLITK